MLPFLMAVILVLVLPLTAMAATDLGSSTEIITTMEPVTEEVVDSTEVTEISGPNPADTLVITPDAIREENPYDPDWPYPYGLPVDNDLPEDLLEADPYTISLLADMSLIPDEMHDNAILRALEYTGYDVQWLKDNGYLYVAQYCSSNLKTYAPQVLSGIGYDDYAPYMNGDETAADSSTVTGKAPAIASFEANGMVCASFVTYYLCNYLPNIEGVDTTWIHNAVKATTMNNGSYSTASVWSWETGLTNLANTAGGGVTRYTDANTAYANLVPGDVIIFSNSSGNLTHAAIYAGAYTMYNASGTNRGIYHYIIHVGNSRGPEISAVEYMVSSGSKSSAPSAWYHIELPEVQSTGFIEVNKKDPNGKSLSGAYFTAVDQSTGDKFVIGPTNSSGYAKSGELPLGTYKVTETVFPDGYEASGQTSWTVTLTRDTPNMTITINAVNKLTTGTAKIVKTITNGGTRAGWHFTVKNAGGSVIGSYVTDSTGVIALNLTPGTYTVSETDGAALFWVNDPNPTRTVTVKANETSTVTFTNQWLGQAKIVKTTTNGGRVDGWTFTIRNAGGTFVGKYQLISTLPSITSESTYLTCYTFVDTLSKGITYNRNDVVLEFFTDSGCNDKIATWNEADGKFTVSYSISDNGESVMTIEMTAAGLNEINTAKTVYTEAGMVNSGYSDCSLRITYAAAMNSDASVVYGDNGNPNEVVLLWQRSSQDYYDTLVDDSHVFSYGIELTKLFSDGQGDLSNVEFIIHNETDGYYVKAELNEAEGIYYATDHVDAEADATHFIPVADTGKVTVKGMEDDTYTITEVRTDNGYTLLKEDIKVILSQTESTVLCDIYASDVLGLIQNDPRYATIINDTGDLKNIPQKHLEHNLLTASATVD